MNMFFRYGSGVWAEELFWFIRGWTSSKELQEKNSKSNKLAALFFNRGSNKVSNLNEFWEIF